MKDKKYSSYIAIGITLICVVAAALIMEFAINKFAVVRQAYTNLMQILSPIIYGIVFAFLLSPAYNHMFDFFTKNLSKIIKRKKTARSIARGISTTICLIILLVVVVGLSLMLIPQLISSVQSMLDNLPARLQNANDYIVKLLEDNPEQKEIIYEQYQKLTATLTDWVANGLVPNIDKYIFSLSSGVMNAVNTFMNFIIGIIVMMYLLNIKGTLIAQAKKISYSILPLSWANELVEECIYIKDVFSKFIVGKIIDSVIIGILCFIVLYFLEMPYPLLISAFVGITNVIPFFGPFLGAIPSAVLLLLVSPIKCFEFIIFIIILQQFDGNILGPKILGKSTGLSSFWILFAILLFGGWFGIVGMIIAVPTFAVIYKTVAKLVDSSLRKHNLSDKTIDYWGLKHIDTETLEYIKEEK